VAVLCRSPLPSVLLASGSPFPVIIALAFLHDEVRTQPTCILVGIEGVAAIIAGYRIFLRYEDKPSFMNLSIRIPLPKAVVPIYKIRSVKPTTREANADK
jgi:hypothetical protein